MFSFLWSDLSMTRGQVQLFRTNMCVDDRSVSSSLDMSSIRPWHFLNLGCVRGATRTSTGLADASTGNMRLRVQENICAGMTDKGYVLSLVLCQLHQTPSICARPNIRYVQHDPPTTLCVISPMWPWKNKTWLFALVSHNLRCEIGGPPTGAQWQSRYMCITDASATCMQPRCVLVHADSQARILQRQNQQWGDAFPWTGMDACAWGHRSSAIDFFIRCCPQCPRCFTARLVSSPA